MTAAALSHVDRSWAQAGRSGLSVRPIALNDAPSVLNASLGLTSPIKLVPEAKAPVLHPNGFIKIPLGIDKLGQRLYLHIWQDKGSDPNIHDHRWSFASTLVTGCLTNTTFALSPCKGNHPGALFIAHYTPQEGRFTLCDSGEPPVIAIPRDATKLTTGGQYTQSHRLLHRVAALAGTVTLVVRGRPVRSEARVLTTQPEHNASPQTLHVIESTERDTIVRSVLAQLA